MAGTTEDFWASFGDPSGFEEVVCEGEDRSLACKVLDDFGIQYENEVGGGLKDLDIKRMDAIQVIKLSLLEESANGDVIYDIIVNSEGKVEFIEVGEDTGLSGEDIYYEIQTGTYREKCGGVMITGKKPRAWRREIKWLPIWGDNDSRAIYNTSLLVNTCVENDYSQQATIIFHDPHLSSTYMDGIDNLYEINRSNPNDVIMGYARFIDWPTREQDKDAVVKRSTTATILLKIVDKNDSDVGYELGTLFRRPQYDENELVNPECYEGQGVVPDPTTGVEVPIPDTFRFVDNRGNRVDKLQAVLDVYVVGIELDLIRGRAKEDRICLSENPNPNEVDVMVWIQQDVRKMKRLDKGIHYVVGYEGLDAGDKTPYIVFANNLKPTDPVDLDGKKETDFLIDKNCPYAIATGKEEGSGLILPVGESNGFLVEQIYVSVILDTPSIDIFNPDGKNKKAEQIAADLTYDLAPLILVDEKKPVAFNGQLLDLTQGIKDHDPTTSQNFEDTDLEKAYDQMQGTGVSLNLSFLDGEQCKALSGSLYKYFNDINGTESTYVCAPDAVVNLGGIAPNGGIVNSIVYSYQDSNSYTISVNAGPALIGSMAQIDGGPAPKTTEDVSTVGTIVQDMGDHIFFKVYTDDFGDRIAINTVASVLRVGDRVQCTVHNCPVED